MENFDVLYTKAAKVAEALLAQLGLDIADVTPEDKRNDFFWLKTYPETCNYMGILSEDNSLAYGDDGNRDPYVYDDRLFTMTVLAAVRDMDDYFCLDFNFFDKDLVILEVGATEVHSSRCSEIIRLFSGFDEGDHLSYKQAGEIMKKMYSKFKKDNNYFQKMIFD